MKSLIHIPSKCKQVIQFQSKSKYFQVRLLGKCSIPSRQGLQCTLGQQKFLCRPECEEDLSCTQLLLKWEIPRESQTFDIISWDPSFAGISANPGCYVKMGDNKDNAYIVGILRIPDTCEAKIVKICNFWTFQSVTQLINHLFKI